MKLDRIINESINKFIIKEFHQQKMTLSEIIRTLDSMYADGELVSDILDFLVSQFGLAIGNGSSRFVFEIDDYTVLKIARNSKGLAQNQQEYMTSMKYKEFSVIPKTYYKSKDYCWIISERIIQATLEDFKKILGLPFSKYADSFTTFKYNDYPNNPKLSDYVSYTWFVNKTADLADGVNLDIKDIRTIYKLASKSKTLDEIFYLITECDAFASDIMAMPNLGIAMRYGEPNIVILDIGITNDMFNKLY